jgi:hypothetical protein
VLFDRLNRIGVPTRLKLGERKEGQIPARFEAGIQPHRVLYSYNRFISTSRELQVVIRFRRFCSGSLALASLNHA